ncbi:MAG: prepilin peptidase [Chloroflexota bacterium]
MGLTLPSGAPLLPSLLVVALVLVGLYTDMRWRRLPNWLTLGGALVALLLQVLLRGLPGGLDSLLGWGLGCLLLFIPFAMRGMGAGDVKMLAAVGATRGPAFVLSAFLLAALVGGLLSIGIMLKSGTFVPTLVRLGGGLRWMAVSLFRYRMLPTPALFSTAGAIAGGVPESRPARMAPLLPYGVAIAAGTLLALGLGY